MPPKPPLKYQHGTIHLDLSLLSKTIVETEELRQQAFDFSRLIQKEVVIARTKIGEDDAMTSLRSLVNNHPLGSSVRGATTDMQVSRRALLTNRMEDVICLEAYHYFVKTGEFLSLSKLQGWYKDLNLTDEEYLAGACMGLAQNLQRYGLGRATVRDVESVQAAAILVSDIQSFLLQLDFRNGPLRRKYDGTKYALKALETLLYELAVTGTGDIEQDTKRLKTNSLLPSDEMGAIKTRMEHQDQLREDLIKQCRDGQKAAKQAIFALHRGDTEKADALIAQCQDSISNKLRPLVAQSAPLRSSGSFTGVLEEFVEARLFRNWLGGASAVDEPSSTSQNIAGVLLKSEDFSGLLLDLRPDEYLGGLCDLSGEVGRFAVQEGTSRNVVAVRYCHETNEAICNAIQSLERYPSGVGKKLDAVRRSVEKIERMLYELSLSVAAGGLKVHSDIEVQSDKD